MKKMLSGIKPTGNLHLGNYIGAISQFVKYQDEYEIFVFIANQHAITVATDKKEIKDNTKDIIAFYLAAGLSKEKATIFLQSDVPAHAQLGWVMTCNSYLGELNRMTQFKDKNAKNEENLTAGLYTYPCLMAADIIMYDADYVPVGIDQKQHVELARDLVHRFNNRYGDTFISPEPLMPKVGAKIMSLQEPTKKMSKSAVDPKGCIDLKDDPKVARKKVMSAITDSIGQIKYDVDNQPGISNLLTILSVLTNESVESIVKRYEGITTYAEFKTEVADAVVTFLTDLQSKYNEIVKGSLIKETLTEGAQKANYVANKKMRKVYKKIGFQLFD